MNGDPYCSHCGTTFRWVDDDNSNEYISGLRLKVRHLIRNDEYESVRLYDMIQCFKQVNRADNDLPSFMEMIDEFEMLC
ncbi:MAG: hypothetical protein IKH29_02475 [Methanobrevibacter sp.]|uniref:hypothetical protein n=1 Tax=Methanobrevibacter sp. TaxID=66852 RepID=UPI0025F68A99|nr:hypothetical protein [Methanobrevibacter sp.]MBR3112563.1 hypothetical protein [Methanobrevibacter sp.]